MQFVYHCPASAARSCAIILLIPGRRQSPTAGPVTSVSASTASSHALPAAPCPLTPALGIPAKSSPVGPEGGRIPQARPRHTHRWHAGFSVGGEGPPRPQPHRPSASPADSRRCRNPWSAARDTVCSVRPALAQRLPRRGATVANDPPSLPPRAGSDDEGGDPGAGRRGWRAPSRVQVGRVAQIRFAEQRLATRRLGPGSLGRGGQPADLHLVPLR